MLKSNLLDKIKPRKSLLLSCILLVFLITTGCSRPSNVLSEDKMVDLMVDMELTEAYLNTQPSVSNSTRTEMGRRVLELHGVSEESLDTTLAWYGRNMDSYEALFAKVDKEIMKKRKKYTDVPGQKSTEADNLWIFGEHQILSPLAGTDIFSFSFPNNDIAKGSKVELSMYLPNPVGGKGMFGVEYKDGHGEAAINNFSSRNKITITLQTDTAQEVRKLFGQIAFKDLKEEPLYIDSISIRTLPIDSTEYRSTKRSQKTFSILEK